MKIAMIDDGPAGVHVSFDRHAGRMFDGVVGVEGLHSRVRVAIRAGDRPCCVTRSSQVHN